MKLSRPEAPFPAMKTFYRNLHQRVQRHCSGLKHHNERGREGLLVGLQESLNKGEAGAGVEGIFFVTISLERLCGDRI